MLSSDECVTFLELPFGAVLGTSWEMAYETKYPLANLNVGDNNLTGSVPIRLAADVVLDIPIVKYLQELWLQGNPWDGPCAALCEVNVVPEGDMDDAKRATMQEWGQKCRAFGADPRLKRTAATFHLCSGGAARQGPQGDCTGPTWLRIFHTCQ